MDETLPHRNLLDCVDWRSLVRRRLEALDLPRSVLAERVGRSEGWTAQVLHGRRALDPQLVGPIAEALRLDPETTRHLEALVELDSISPRARRRAFAAVQETQRQRASAELQEEAFLLRSRWYAAAIAELASCEGFRLDPAWVAAVLVPPIGEDDAQEVLNALIRLGVLGVDETGAVTPDRSALAARTAAPAQDDAATAAIGSMLSHALDTLRASELDHHLAGIDVALSEEHHARVVERLREFEHELADLAAGDPALRTRVFRIQLQAFPVSLPTDAEPPAASVPEGVEEEPYGPDLDPDTII